MTAVAPTKAFVMPLHPQSRERTPGEIYRMMNAQFRELRAAGHETCLMPAVVWEATLGDGWGLDPAALCCSQCRSLAAKIAYGYRERFVIGLGSRSPQPATCANDVSLAAA